MRVISGKAKGYKLSAVPGRKTRPTTDRVKEAIFSMIGPYFDGGIGLDLFSGTGSLGIEALSRGLDRVIFVDTNIRALQTAQQNLEKTGLHPQAECLKSDAMHVLTTVHKRAMQFDLIFLDPPYTKHILSQVLSQIASLSLLVPNGVVVIEHPDAQAVPKRVEPLTRKRTKQYGNICITIMEGESL